MKTLYPRPLPRVRREHFAASHLASQFVRQAVEFRELWAESAAAFGVLRGAVSPVQRSCAREVEGVIRGRMRGWARQAAQMARVQAFMSEPAPGCNPPWDDLPGGPQGHPMEDER